MQPNERHFKAPWNSASLQAPHGNSLLARVLTAVASIVVLMVAFILSFVIFAAVAGIALVAGGYIWWGARAFRRHFREKRRGGGLIEGQMIPDDSRRPGQLI